MTPTQATAVLATRPAAGFIETPFVRSLTDRALSYLAAGYPVHFRGPAGCGKTKLAMHVAHQIGRPTMLLCGDDEFGTSDLVGGQTGYRRRKVIDNFVHSVLKTEEDVAQRWVDNRLTMACREGLTLVYDEFTRSRPEANNVLLSVLEEKLLVLPDNRSGSSYLRVHPDFTAIFTSNPEDYAGVHKTQDALRDRMVTIDLDYFDRQTEVAITHSRSGVPTEDAERIVDLVRACREAGLYAFGPTIRSCIMIAKVLAIGGIPALSGDSFFQQTCLDVLAAELDRPGKLAKRGPRRRDVVLDLISKHCSAETGSGLFSLPRRA
ncbi:MAG: gas vesicle protein GvpN [Chloroflexota bacterium]|nr:MAG: gas vesicle protein GvpN [Chloroflexota bacterium]